MNIFDAVFSRIADPGAAIIEGAAARLSFNDLCAAGNLVQNVEPGQVVALVGDIDAPSIGALLHLIDKKAIIVPLARASAAQHSYFLEATNASAVIADGEFIRLQKCSAKHPLVEKLRERDHAGLVLFSSGSTGQPKAILHDFSTILMRYDKPAKAWTTLNFLLFDHIGGLNTLFHTLFNGGKIIIPSGRDPVSISRDIKKFHVQLLPATPTFLRLCLLSGMLVPENLSSLELVTYGTERMDQHTLDLVAAALPGVDLRQTYGMSELGILKVLTRKRDELWIRITGEGLEQKIVDGQLYLRSKGRMLGYLNAPDPFDADGWYPTGDLVETDGNWIRLDGRKDWLINVGGLKVLPAEVEHAALSYKGIKFAKAFGGTNPVTGMHVELLYQPENNAAVDMADFRKHLQANLPPHAMPRRIKKGEVPISYRFKRM